MMYPRLKLARNLLTDDGVIFISIDDNEQANLKKICDEIFGESNFVSSFVWEKGKEGGNDSNIMRSHYEYILCFSKNINSKNIINLDPKDTSRHISKDKEKNLVSGIKSNPNKGELFQLINLSKQKDYIVEIPLIDGTKIIWNSYAPQKSIDKWIEIDKVFVGKKRVPYIKSYLKDELQGQKPSNIISQNYGTTKAGSIEIRKLFGSKDIFSYPKPSSLIKRLLQVGTNENCIILDFFSGSATTAHATMQLNAEDGGNRKFIMVQLPEETDEKSEAYKAGYKNICEVGKERIRRAGKKILEENKDKEGIENLDIGFRVLKTDSSNMKDVYYSPVNTQQSLLDSLTDNIKEDRTAEDLLFQIMLDLGISLSSKIEVKEINGKNIFSVEDGFLIACFDKDITEETVKAIAEEQPYYAIFRDSSIADDSVATNIEQIFQTLSPQTVRKVI